MLCLLCLLRLLRTLWLRSMPRLVAALCQQRPEQKQHGMQQPAPRRLLMRQPGQQQRRRQPGQQQQQQQQLQQQQQQQQRGRGWGGLERCGCTQSSRAEASHHPPDR